MKFAVFKKFFWAVNNLNLNDLRRRGGWRDNSPKVKLFLKNFTVQTSTKNFLLDSFPDAISNPPHQTCLAASSYPHALFEAF